MESKTQSENDITSDAFLNKGVGVRAVVGITCSLSIMGAALVILSYICFKSVRSKARELLVHLSLMDFGVAVANLVGVAFYLDRFYSDTVPTKNVILPVSINTTDSDQSPKDVIQNLCTAQAFFSIYFTLGSVLWTLSLALYLYFALVHYKNQQARYFLWLAYAVCWVLPFFLTLWLVLTDRLGYSPYNSSGWCSLVLTDPVTLKNDIFVAIFGYDLWIYTAMILVLILYLAVKAFLKIQVKLQFWHAISLCTYIYMQIYLFVIHVAHTVEPPNNGHIGTFQLSLVVRLFSSRRSIYTQNVQLVHFCLSIIGGCPYLGMSFIGGSTVFFFSFYYAV